MVSANRMFWTRVGTAIAVLVVGVLLLTWWLLRDDPARGTWGDMFGGANALFAGLALGGVVVAIVLQSQELALQRAELEETRREIAGQRVALEQQNATLRAQLLESTILELLRQFREVTRTVGWPMKDRTANGPEAFSRIADELTSELSKLGGPLDGPNGREALGAIFQRLGQTWATAGLSAYLSFFREILVRIGEAPTAEQPRYLRLLTSLMSRAEQDTVAFYCATNEGVALSGVAEGLNWFTMLSLSPRLRFEALGVEPLDDLLAMSKDNAEALA